MIQKNAMKFSKLIQFYIKIMKNISFCLILKFPQHRGWKYSKTLAHITLWRWVNVSVTWYCVLSILIISPLSVLTDFSLKIF